MDETWRPARIALLGRRGRAVPRRSRRRLALQRLPRPERQHAPVRGDARRVRGQRRVALSRSRAAACRPHDPTPGGEGRRPGVGTLRPRLERRLGLPPRRSEAPVPSVGLPARTPDRMGQAAADPRSAHRVHAALPPTGCCRPRAICSTPRWRAPGTAHSAASCYGFAPDGTVCDDDKYFWVQAESIAAAARLGVRTGDAQYWAWYDRLWAYAWRAFRRPPLRRLVSHPRSATIASTATRRAPPARPTTTRWARATTSCTLLRDTQPEATDMTDVAVHLPVGAGVGSRARCRRRIPAEARGDAGRRHVRCAKPRAWPRASGANSCTPGTATGATHGATTRSSR